MIKTITTPAEEDIQDLAGRMKLMEEIEEMFLMDMNTLLYANDDFLQSTISNVVSPKQRNEIYGKNLFDIFLYSMIFQYERTEENKIAIISAIKKEYSQYLNPEYVEKLIKNITLYFDSFDLPELNLSDLRDKQIDAILKLPDDDEYKIRLYSILLEDLYNTMPEIEKYNSINVVLNDYYFFVTMPAEDEQLSQKHREINRVLIDSDKHSIPDMSYLFEGKTYQGHSVAELIKDVGWKPKPSGSRSRLAQENRLRQFMDWETQPLEKNKTITVIRSIYDEMLERGKPKLYESLIEIPLLYALYNADNETIYTTRKNFFYDIGIISPNFQRVPIQYYRDTLPENYIEDDSDISVTRSVFYDAIYSKLRELLFSTLESLKKRKKIRYSTSTIIVVAGKQRINVSELPENEAIEIDKKILAANEYALQHTYYFDGRMKRACNTWENIMRYRKNQEYKKVYENFINDNYGWSYTYEQIRITAGTKSSIEKSITEAQSKLRNTLIQYLKKNSQTRLKNRNERINAEYQKLLEQIESTGFSKDVYKDDFNKLSLKVRPFPKYFIDIFGIMVDTEIDRNPEIEQQIAQWKKAQKQC